MVFADESEEPPVDLELKTIQEARDQNEGDVKTKVVVTAKLKNTLHIQDEGAGIAIYPVLSDVQLVDEITVIGSLSRHTGMLQIQNANVDEKNEDVGVDRKSTRLNPSHV